jgi:hypothetical protein
MFDIPPAATMKGPVANVSLKTMKGPVAQSSEHHYGELCLIFLLQQQLDNYLSENRMYSLNQRNEGNKVQACTLS